MTGRFGTTLVRGLFPPDLVLALNRATRENAVGTTERLGEAPMACCAGKEGIRRGPLPHPANRGPVHGHCFVGGVEPIMSSVALAVQEHLKKIGIFYTLRSS